MEFRKIKYSGEPVKIEYTNNKKDSLALEGNEEPLQSFKDALTAFNKHFIDIAELDRDSDVSVSGISLSLDKSEQEQIIITGLRTLSTGKKLLINTPIFKDADWPDDLTKAVVTLKDEASKYINGSRKYEQTTLFDQDFDKSDEEIDNEKKHKEFAQLKQEELTLTGATS